MRAPLDLLRTAAYRFWYGAMLRKLELGPGTRICCRLELVGPGHVRFGANCRVEPDPWGEDHVTIYTHRPGATVTIGDNVTLRGTRIGSHLSITIGPGAIVDSASLFDSDFHNVDATKRDEDFNARDRPVVIGEAAYIGCEALCAKGTSVGAGAVVLPTSTLANKVVPPRARAAGNPPTIEGPG